MLQYNERKAVYAVHWCNRENDMLIYCVEDDESIRDLVGYALRGQGYGMEGFGCADDFYKGMKVDTSLAMIFPSQEKITAQLGNNFFLTRKKQVGDSL